MSEIPIAHLDKDHYMNPHNVEPTEKQPQHCPHCDSTNLGDDVCLNCNKEIEL